MRLLKIEALLKADAHSHVYIVPHNALPGHWLAGVKAARENHLVARSIALAPSLLTACAECDAWLEGLVGTQKRAPDTTLLRALHAAQVAFELRWDPVADAFRATARLFPEESSGPVSREACIRWCFDAHSEKAVLRVAAHVAQQLVLDHESAATFGE